MTIHIVQERLDSIRAFLDLLVDRRDYVWFEKADAIVNNRELDELSEEQVSILESYIQERKTNKRRHKGSKTQEIEQLYNEGLSCAEISKKIPCHYSQAYQVIKKLK